MGLLLAFTVFLLLMLDDVIATCSGGSKFRCFAYLFWLRNHVTDQNFLNFMQFLGKSGKFVCWRPPQGLAPPPTGNPVSAPDLCLKLVKLGNSTR